MSIKRWKNNVTGAMVWSMLVGVLVLIAIFTTDFHHTILLPADYIIQNSLTYTFDWNPITRWAVVKNRGKVVRQFFFKPRPLAVWIYKPTNLVMIVTSDNALIDGAHGLYLYDGKEVKKVYQSRWIKVSNDFIIRGHLYTWFAQPDDYSWVVGKEVASDIMPTLGGEYMFLNEAGYEGSAGVTIDVAKKKAIDSKIHYSGPITSSSDGQCFVNVAQDGFANSSVVLGYIDKRELKTMIAPESQMIDMELLGMYWADDCTGILHIKKPTEEDWTKQREAYVAFDVKKGTFQEVSKPKLDTYRGGSRPLDTIENIFFTIKK